MSKPVEYTIYGIIGAIIIWFAREYIVHRLAIRREKRSSFKAAYETFRSVFTTTLQQLETGDTTLNVLILGDFPKHDAAFKEFFSYFKFFRKKWIYKKWQEYEGMYYELKKVPFPFSVTLAIPPPGELPINPTPETTQRWENIRINKLYNIIQDLLNLTSKNSWF